MKTQPPLPGGREPVRQHNAFAPRHIPATTASPEFPTLAEAIAGRPDCVGPKYAARFQEAAAAGQSLVTFHVADTVETDSGHWLECHPWCWSLPHEFVVCLLRLECGGYTWLAGLARYFRFSEVEAEALVADFSARTPGRDWFVLELRSPHGGPDELIPGGVQ